MLIFLIYLLKTLIVGTRWGGSNEYPQSMFWSKNKKNRYTPANPSFTNIKVGYTFHGHILHDGRLTVCSDDFTQRRREKKAV